MKLSWVLLCIFALNLIVLALSGSKYDKKINDPDDLTSQKKRDRPFRTNKVNLVWEKAQKVSDIRRLRPQSCLFTLYVVLQTFG